METITSLIDLETYLNNQTQNTVDTPYEITLQLNSSDAMYVQDTINNCGKYLNITFYYELPSYASQFENCLYLVEIHCYSRIAASMFKGCTNLKKLYCEVYFIINSSAFENCTSLEYIEAKNNSAYLDLVGTKTFYGCTNLTDVVIPNQSSWESLNGRSSSISSLNFDKGVTKDLKFYLGDTASTFKTEVSSYKEKVFGSHYLKIKLYNCEKPLDAADYSFPESYSVTTDGIVSVDQDEYADFLCYNYLSKTHTSTKDSPIKINITNIGTSFNPAKNGAESSNYPIYFDSDGSQQSDFKLANFNYIDFSVTELNNEVTSYSLKGTNVMYAPDIPNSVTSLRGSFDNCTKLLKAPKIPNSVTDLTNAFYACTTLTSITNFPNNAANFNNTFLYCWDLYNGGIIRDTFENINEVPIFPTGSAGSVPIKAIGILRDSIDEYSLQDISNVKIYTTAQYFTSLSASIETNYPNSNFEIIQVDACVDFDELEGWLSAQPQNSADSPYKIFIGGGLSEDKLKGSIFKAPIINRLYYYASDLSVSIYKGERYVDLYELCLPYNCTNLTTCLSGQAPTSSQELKFTQTYITKSFEIPTTVTTMNGFATESTGLKTIGTNSLIPSSVTDAKWAIYDTSSLKEIIINHQITGDFSEWTYAENFKIYAKDYTYFSNNYSGLHTNRQIILECDFSELDTYLGWFRNSVTDVNLKVNGLVASDLIRDTTLTSRSSLGYSLMGYRVSDSTVKSYVRNSTFDLRLTELPQSITSLYGCLAYSNVSYSFEIPDGVTTLESAFEDCPSLSEAPTIPNTVTNMSLCFYNNDSLHYPPEIPDSVTNMSQCFSSCSELRMTPIIPDSVTNMERCFYLCTSLHTIRNVPASVTNLDYAFASCSGLTVINNWALDVTQASLTQCFLGCSSLDEINTISAPVSKTTKWVNYTIKTDTTDTTKYNITARTLTGETATIQVDKAVVKSYFTDEILFSPQGTLTDTFITDMLQYRLPFGNGLDPSKKNFILWADEDGEIYSNISGGGTVKSVNNTLPDGSGNVNVTSVSGSSGSCTGNAATATTLETARTINGTSFDGSANITTSKWGTARNISISDSDATNTGTAVSVNGSGAVTLKLPSTIKANLSGKATSASSADSADYATEADVANLAYQIRTDTPSSYNDGDIWLE